MKKVTRKILFLMMAGFFVSQTFALHKEEFVESVEMDSIESKEETFDKEVFFDFLEKNGTSDLGSFLKSSSVLVSSPLVVSVIVVILNTSFYLEFRRDDSLGLGYYTIAPLWVRALGVISSIGCLSLIPIIYLLIDRFIKKPLAFQNGCYKCLKRCMEKWDVCEHKFSDLVLEKLIKIREKYLSIKSFEERDLYLKKVAKNVVNEIRGLISVKEVVDKVSWLIDEPQEDL